MLGRFAFFAVVALVGAHLAGSARAQDSDPVQPRRVPTLSDRLQQLRQDLLGDPNGQRRAPPDNSTSPDRRAVGRSVTGSPKLATPQADALSPPTPPNPPIAVSQQMQVQSARRAQAGSGANSADSEAVDEEASDESADQSEARPTPQQTPAVARRLREEESSEEKKEPQQTLREDHRVARSQPLPVQPKALRDADSTKPPRTRAHNHGLASGVLFTTESPVLSVEVSGPRKVLIGREAPFSVAIRNAGPAANNVVVSVHIPSYAEVASVEPTSGTAQASAPGERREPLEWKINRLEAKSTETLNIKLVPRKSTPLDLAVSWTFAPEASQTLVEVQEPKLVMGISGPEEVLYGQSKIYKLTVSNPGNGDTENVTVGLLPIGRAAENPISHRLGTLRAGESRSIDIELTARQAGAITIKAQAFADGGLRVEAAEQVLVRRANLRLEVEAPKVKYAGTVGTYHIKVVNAGNATAENVQLSAMLPPDAKYLSSNSGGKLEEQQGKINWTVGTLQPGGQRVFETQCSLSAPGENRTQFVAVADGDLSAAMTSSTRVEALADLKLEVRDPQGPIAVGEDALYEVHIRNRGTKAADQIDLAVCFSEGLEAVAVEGGQHEITPGQVLFKPIASIGAGETAVLRVRARADRAGNHRFRAEVICQSLHTKLAAEEATQFYGEEKPVVADRLPPSEPVPTPRETPLESDAGEPAPIQPASDASE